MGYFFCMFTLFCLVLPAIGKPENTFKNMQLGEDLPWITQTYENQVLTDREKVIQLLNKFFKWNSHLIPEKPLDMIEVEEKKQGGLERKRSQQDRKVGCRIFFWKTWTAC